MSGVDIRFDREYLFVSKETGEHVIMKVENEGVVKRTRHAVRFKTQNYIQREVLGAVMPWEKIQMEDFNKLNLELVAEYDPEPEDVFTKALTKLQDFAIEIGIDEFEARTDVVEDLTDLIREQLCDMEDEVEQDADDNYPESEKRKL